MGQLLGQLLYLFFGDQLRIALLRGQECKQMKRHLESVGDALECFDSRLSFFTFNKRKVASVKAASIRQFLLSDVGD